MTDEQLFEFEGEQSGQRAAALLRELADGLADGRSIELGADDGSVAFEAPADLDVGIELEAVESGNGTRLELELEFEWDADDDGWSAAPSAESTESPPVGSSIEPDEGRDAPTADVEIAVLGGPQSRARFEVFRDRVDEWRWRLVHRNGNVIATSGEGYTTRRNAEKGLTSVMANAPGAELVDEE